MNFNFGTPKTTGGATATTTTASTPMLRLLPSTPLLNFGSGDTSKNLEQNQTPAKTPSFGLNFGTSTTTTPGTGFTLGTAASTTPTLNFGTPSTQSTFALVTPTTTKSSTLSGFSLNASAASTNIPSLGGITSGGLTLATPATGLTPVTGLTPASSTTTGFSLGGTAATTTTPGLNFGSLSSTAISLGGTTTTTPSLGFSLGKATTTATPILNTSTTSTTAATITTTTIASTTQGSINYNQIEEILNKWTLELEEQGKVFINQALQLNAWDRLVIANGEKILNLNNGIEKVKQQQQQLDHELEFVLIQQRELEECISPLEKELKDIPIADQDRNHTYQMAENMDTQLKQMSEDLKEIIEHLNESNKSEDNNDPVSQIGRILNAHMNSLQWIDRNTAQITTLLDQITKMHDLHRRDNERSFHLTYE